MTSNFDSKVDLLRKKEGNGTCFECGNVAATWASVNLGCFLCLNCAGDHRSLGVHLSFVRSITLDTWNQRQYMSMRLGGNEALRKALEDVMNLPIKKRYETEAAQNYREKLKSSVYQKLGVPPPEVSQSPPKPKTPSITNTSFSSSPEWKGPQFDDHSSSSSSSFCSCCLIV